MPATAQRLLLCTVLCPRRMAARGERRPADPAPTIAWRRKKILCTAAPIRSRSVSVQWNGWGRDLDNTRYQPEPAIRAIDVAETRPEVGVRLPERHRIRPAHRRRRPTVRQQLRRHGSMPWTRRAAAPTGPMTPPAGSRTAIFDRRARRKRSVPRYREESETHPRAPGRHQGAERRILRRRHRRRVCARRAEGHVAVEDAGRHASAGAHRRVRRPCTTTACTSPWARRKSKWRRIPNYGCCTFRGSVAALDIAQRPSPVEELHRARGAATDPQEQRRRAGVRPCGCRHRRRAHHRPQARRAVRRHRRFRRPASSSRSPMRSSRSI